MRIVLVPLALISLASLFFINPATALSTKEYEGPSANGSFEIFLEKGAKRRIEFHAVRDLNGKVTGETTFQDEVPQEQVDKSTDANNNDAQKPFFMHAQFDCLIVEGNRAVMSGSVTEASSEQYVGKRVLVVAQENGGAGDPARRDKLTWGIYRTPKSEWLPGDSERPEELSGLSWIASDSERPEDEGVSSIKETVVGCQSFPVSSFSFLNATQAKGTAHVKP
ncbi:MAG TPA: hypothetical protein VI306_19620 [Pyrinomonadaceae bacterium]